MSSAQELHTVSRYILSGDRQRYDVVHLRRLGAAGLSEVREESSQSLEHGTFQTANESGDVESTARLRTRGSAGFAEEQALGGLPEFCVTMTVVTRRTARTAST